ncbi:MAG: response regulator [bacterium]
MSEKPKTILVVEDDSSMLSALQRYLESLGYRVHPATDGIEALEYLSSCETSPDLILTDIAMPRMDGMALLRAAKTKQSNLPVVFLTGKCQSQFSGQDEPRPEAVLYKPLQLDELKKALAQIFNHTGS